MSQIGQFAYDEDYFLNNDLHKLNEKLKTAILFLKDLTKQPSKVFIDADCYEALILIGKIIYNLSIDFSIFVANEFEKIVSTLFMYFYEIRNELHFEDNNISNDLNAKRIELFGNLLFISNKIQSRSLEYCNKFVLSQGLRAYILFLSDDKFKQKNSNVKINDLSNVPQDLLEYLIINVCSLRNTSEELRYKWNEFNIIDILLKISKEKKSKHFEISCLITYIVDDNQIEAFSDFEPIIQILGKYLIKCKNDFKVENFDRITTRVKMNLSTINCQVHKIYDGESKTLITLNGLLNSFYKLSVNPKMRNEIYFQNEIKTCLETFLVKGNHFEIYFTLTLIAQLSFSPEIQIDMMNSSEILSIFDGLSSKDLAKIKEIDEKEVYSNIKILVEIIKWNLTEQIEINQTQGEYILISYNMVNRVMCLRIKEKLESFGFKVWMHSNDIHNSSSLEVMARAVEQSYCILMCITEKYRSSLTCQFEALYAFKMNKKIIPLVMQSSFETVKVNLY